MKITIATLVCWAIFSINGFGRASDTTMNKVKVVFTYSKNIFPTDWQGGTINASGEGMNASEIVRTKKVLTVALSKYPEALMVANLKAVFFLKDMSFYGVGYGGTNSTSELYLTNNGTDKGYTDKYVEQTFHHEFSSILLRNHITLLDTAGWRKASNDFSYTDSLDGVGAIIKNEASQEIDTILCKRGILTQYALSGMENDVNTFAQNLFKPENAFWSVVAKYPSIHKKTLMLINFYHKLNPLFCEAYFKKFAGK
ncbi:MAG: hypothetical protein ABIX01_19120 [Chitinophagaceae bacterium]